MTLAAVCVGALVVGQEPPRIAGVVLGDSAAHLRASLGAPDRREISLGFEFWEYERRGIRVVLDRDVGRIRAVVLRTRRAGGVEGVRVGDPAGRARARWGPTARVRQGGRFVDFVRAGWAHSAEMRDGRVVEITVLVQ